MAYTSGSPGVGLEIGIALVLQDRFSNQAREASSQIKKLHMDAKNAINANLQAIQSVAQTGYNISRAAGAKLRSVIVDASEFIDMMTMVDAISGASDSQMKSMTKTAQTLGARTMLMSKDIASGMKYLAMAGTHAKDIDGVIKGAALLSNSTGLQLGGKGGAADLITNIMRMFKITNAEASMGISDQLAKATLSANISMTDLAESIRYAGASMVMLKQSIPQTAALIGTLGNSGIQGSIAGTSIRNMADYLTKSIYDPKTKGAKRLAILGLGKDDFVNAKGDLMDFSVILEKIRNKITNQPSAELPTLFNAIFGVRGKRAAVAVMNDLEGYRKLLQKIQHESAGTVEAISAKRLDTLPGALEQFTSNLENFRTSFTLAIEPVLKPIVQFASKVIEIFQAIFDIPILGNILSTITVFGTALAIVFTGLGYLRTKILLLKNDSQIHGNSWFKLLIGGWTGASLKAKEYMLIQGAIINQQKLGIGGNVAFSAMAKNPGQWFGNARATTDKNGRTLYWKRSEDKMGMKRTTPAGASQAMGKGGIPGYTGFLMGNAGLPGGVSKTSTGTVNAAGGMSSKIGKGLGMGGALRGLGGVMGRVLGFVSGPWGLAISAGMMILPGLFSAIKESASSSNRNTEATKELKNQMREDFIDRMARIGKSEDQQMTEEMRKLAATMQFWAEAILKKTPEIYQNISLNVDGKKLAAALAKGKGSGEAEVNLETGVK